MAYAHGTTGVADVRAPSWSGRSQRITDYLNNWLAEGYAVVATDYQGLGTPGGHPWMTVRAEAFSVLDSVRSALNAFPELVNSVVIVGQSQGAHAGLSAMLLANSYARGLNLKGGVATAVPSRAPYLPSAGAVIPLPADPALLALRLFTFQALDAGFKPADFLSEGGKAVFEASRTGCGPESMRAVAEHKVTVDSFLTKPLTEAAAKAAPFQQYPPLRFGQPVFIATGVNDTTVAPGDQHGLATAACAAGSTIQRLYYPGVDHTGTSTASQPDSLSFVRDVFAGRRVLSSCSSLAPPPTQ